AVLGGPAPGAKPALARGAGRRRGGAAERGRRGGAAEGARLDPPPALDDGRIAAALPPAGAGPAGARGPARAGPGVPARVVARAAGGGEVDGPRAPRREGGGEAEVAGVDHRPLPR